ncbi:hypothetical protein EVAR_77165_1 [Eumeta japonica]|uniref:Uncharacterized protein n=1 Tax=Eumeta variegata TaxID=151549 RepID=A0A4C1T2V7_EUMVA|nr:hypothetical protein EVAR_77165_1 [Eumeta japonica]
MDEVQSISGSIFKYVTKANDGQSSSEVPDFLADESNDLNNMNLPKDLLSDRNIDNTESMKRTHYKGGPEINTENDDDNVPSGDERRIRRKKPMPGELASSTDDGLTLPAQINGHCSFESRSGVSGSARVRVRVVPHSVHRTVTVKLLPFVPLLHFGLLYRLHAEPAPGLCAYRERSHRFTI